MKLSHAKLKQLPLNECVSDGNKLYFTRTGVNRGKFTMRYQRWAWKHNNFLSGITEWSILYD